MNALDRLNIIHDLEMKWRETNREDVEASLTRHADIFLSTCVEVMYKWYNYTRKRHPNTKDLLGKINRALKTAVDATTLDQKLIAIELCMNTHHQTNYFPGVLRSVAEEKNAPCVDYYEDFEDAEA